MKKRKKTVENLPAVSKAVMPDTPTPQHYRRRISIAAGIIIAAGLVVYFNSFNGAFLYDDLPSITENPHIRKLWPLSQAMSLPLANSGLTVSGRPLLSLSFAINYALSQCEPFGYHLTNLIIHIASALLLFGVIHRTLQLEQFRQHYTKRALPLAMAVALIWLVHPLHTESVTYIAQRAESMMGMFFLLTLYCAIRGFQSKHPLHWYILSVLTCALGMGTKEVMVIAPLMLLLYDYFFDSGSLRTSLHRHWGLYAAQAATWSILVALIFLTRKMISRDFQMTGPLNYALTQPGVILYYLKLSFWPSPLIMDYNWPTAKNAADILYPAIMLLLLLAPTLWALFRRRWFGFVGAWFFLILAPSSSFIPTKQNLHEHRMYLSLAAVITLVVIAADHLLRKALLKRPTQRLFRIVTAVSLIAIVAALGYLTYERNKVYRSGLALWTDNTNKRPESNFAHYNLGVTLAKQGKFEQAKDQYLQSIRINPHAADPHFNLGVIVMKEGNLPRARAIFERVLRIDPNHANAHNNLGIIFAREQNIDRARAEFEHALRINPNHTDAHYNLARIFIMQKKLDRFWPHYDHISLTDPAMAEQLRLLLEQHNYKIPSRTQP